MMHISLYRKYRSQKFEEIIGQEPIIRTLQNALKNNRLSHAYLFAGPRGTGKTSTARILAKALNCQEGPTPSPCSKCDLCQKISSGQALDVIEIDAASNRGIDEIRDLRERVRYTPAEGKYKVYIIDEVHMLTTEAFNALLKTLEEPPAHVIFVLATTQAQKVPVTILSRCQRFDFARITYPKIIARIKAIAAAEKVTIDDGALGMVATAAEGSMRDAISLLDQLISFCEKKITRDDVMTVLGTADTELLASIVEAVAAKDISQIISLVDKAVADGCSIPQVTKDLVEYFRYLMLASLKSEAALELPQENIERIKKQAESFSFAKIKEALRIFSRAELDQKWHPQTRIILEVALIEIVGKEGEKDEVVAPKIQVETPKQGIKVEDDAKVKPMNDTLTKIKGSWSQILEKVKSRSVFGFVALKEGEPWEVKDGKLVVRFRTGFSFYKERLDDGESKVTIEESIKEIIGENIILEGIVNEDEKKSPTFSGGNSSQVSARDVVNLFKGKIVSEA